MPDPHKDFEIGDCKAISGKVPASVCFEPLLEPGKIKWDRARDQLFPPSFFLLFR